MLELTFAKAKLRAPLRFTDGNAPVQLADKLESMYLVTPLHIMKIS